MNKQKGDKLNKRFLQYSTKFTETKYYDDLLWLASCCTTLEPQIVKVCVGRALIFIAMNRLLLLKWAFSQKLIFTAIEIGEAITYKCKLHCKTNTPACT